MYLKWKEKTTNDFSSKNIGNLYQEGYLFGRQEKGMAYQTRSVRIDLSQFELSSENRRVLRKTEGIELQVLSLPYADYHWPIGKMGKDFYEQKFGDGTFSANKIKELLTDDEKSNFNRLLTYSFSYQTSVSSVESGEREGVNPENILGYCIALETNGILHYCYPFYDLAKSPKDMGLGMMTRAIVYAKETDKKYMYLGSAQRPSDIYKLQFAGVEWWNEAEWTQDAEQLKMILKEL